MASPPQADSGGLARLRWYQLRTAFFGKVDHLYFIVGHLIPQCFVKSVTSPYAVLVR